MAQDKPTLGERLMEGLRFWTVVVVICGVMGLIAYTVGKKYVGSHLHEMEIKEGAPEISPLSDELARPDGDDDTPPEKPVIVMREREPTARERREAERAIEAGEPQDGAALHAQEEAEEEGASDEAADEEAEDEAAGDEGGDEGAADEGAADAAAADEPADQTGAHVVSAGSFASEDNAQVQVAKLAGMGYHPYVTRVEKDGVTFTRVNVGQYPSRNKAEGVADELRAKGFDAAVYGQ